MATTAAITSSCASVQQAILPLLEHIKYDDLAVLLALAFAGSAYVAKGTLWAKPDLYRYQLYERPQQLLGTTSSQKRNRNVAETLRQSNTNIAIFWASQSGTAERLAGRLAKDLKAQLSLKVILIDISDIDPASWVEIQQTQLAIIMASTFGEGDPSDNMHEFWAWLHQDDGNSLPNLRYLAFGLGNSKYKHYNHVIDVVTARLNDKGARALLPTAKADDAAGETEEHFLEWKERVLDLLQIQLGHQRQITTYEPTLEVELDESIGPINVHHGDPTGDVSSKMISTCSRTYALPVLQSRELFNSKERNCLYMEFDLSMHPDLKYKTGDHLGVWPINPTQEVDLLIHTLGLQETRDVPCHIKSLEGATVKIPSPTTIQTIFEQYLEICATVSRECVSSLITFAPNDAAKTFLRSISCDKQAYSTFLASNYITLGRLLSQACGHGGAWHCLPLSYVIELLPTMQPRYYSISSSSVVEARSASITAVVANTPLSRPAGDDCSIPGLATNYLLALKRRGCGTDDTPRHTQSQSDSLALLRQSLQAGHVYAHLRKSSFKLPVIASTPILMVAAGTGLAPFRAFVQERARLLSIGRIVGPTKLFFGCRNAKEDFIFQDELSNAKVILGDSFSLSVAFSRPDSGQERRYVQHYMLDDSQTICDLLVSANAYFYICGSAAMARDVSNTVEKILRSGQSWDDVHVTEFVARQKRQKRWKQDVWG